MIIDGLRQLQLHIDEQQVEALLHCWNIVGHILGIREELQAHTMAEAEQLARAIQRRHYAGCPEGQDMTRALIQMMQQYLPGNLLDPIPPLLVRALLGDAYADLLAVDPVPAPQLLSVPLKVFNLTVVNATNSCAIASAISGHFSRRMIEGILLANRGGHRIPFDVPTELLQTWGVNWKAA